MSLFLFLFLVSLSFIGREAGDERLLTESSPRCYLDLRFRIETEIRFIFLIRNIFSLS
jgi:hypothetical protein